ncbi:hypothetical protein D3C75_914680 [compost metagenome]
MRLQCLRISAKAVLAFITARCNHETVIDQRCGVADDHRRKHADLVVQHIFQCRDDGQLAVAVGAFYDAHRSGGIAVAEQNPAGLFNLACPLPAARIVEGNYKVCGSSRLHARRNALPGR